MNDTTVVRIPARYTAVFTVGGALAGLALAFLVGPVVGWLVGLVGDAPGPLELLAEVPLGWAVPLLMLVGAVAGFLIVANWIDRAGTIDVNDAGVTVHSKEADRYIPKAKTDRIFAEKAGEYDLVILDAQTRELFRGKVEAEMLPGLREALQRRGYPSLETADPFGEQFSTWVEGDGRLDQTSENLLCSRRRALADNRNGEAEDALEKLHRAGIMVRDRDGRQQYRRL